MHAVFCLFTFLPHRCLEPPEPAGHLRHTQGPPASGCVSRDGGRSLGALLPPDPPHPEHLQEYEW